MALTICVWHWLILARRMILGTEKLWLMVFPFSRFCTSLKNHKDPKISRATAAATATGRSIRLTGFLAKKSWLQSPFGPWSLTATQQRRRRHSRRRQRTTTGCFSSLFGSLRRRFGISGLMWRVPRQKGNQNANSTGVPCSLSYLVAF